MDETGIEKMKESTYRGYRLFLDQLNDPSYHNPRGLAELCRDGERIADSMAVTYGYDLAKSTSLYEEVKGQHEPFDGYSSGSDNDGHFSPSSSNDSTSSDSKISRKRKRGDDDDSFNGRILFGSPNNSSDREFNEEGSDDTFTSTSQAEGESDSTTASQVDGIISEPAPAHQDLPYDAATSQTVDQPFGQNISETQITSSVASLTSSAVVPHPSVDVRTELDIMLKNFEKNGSAAGSPLVLYILRSIIKDSFETGNLDNVSSCMGSIIQLLQAKSAVAEAYVIDPAKRIIQTFPKLSRDLTMGEMVQRLEIARQNEEDIPVSMERKLFDEAIRLRNSCLEKSIPADKYCNLSKSAKSQLIVAMHLCITINAMSLLPLSTFCGGDLLEEVRKLGDTMQNDSGEKWSMQSMKVFTETILIPAINSSNKEVVVAAVRIACKMREAITDEIAHPTFKEAQNMRFDGRGNSEGRDYCGAQDDYGSRIRSSMLNHYFSLVLAARVEDEFETGFFNECGGFSGTILRGAWRDIRDYCQAFTKKEFFTSLGYNNDKSREAKNMTKLKGKTLHDTLPVVIFDQEQMECLQSLCTEIA
jgi:hypothetical protein